MELELLYGIFSRIGQYYVKGGHQKIPQPLNCSSPTKESKKTVPSYDKLLKSRDNFLYKRNIGERKKHFSGGSSSRKYTGDCAQSIASSGYASHRTSVSPSPVRGRSRERDLEEDEFLDNDDSFLQQEESDPDLRERIWLVCQTGVVAARINRGTLDDNVENPGPINEEDYSENLCKIEVELEETGELITVEKKFIEKANVPGGLPPWEDIDQDTIINESELLAAFSQNFCNGEYQSKIGEDCIVSINPMRKVENWASKQRRGRKYQEDETGEEDVLKQEAEIVYRRALETEQPQTMVFTGRSGSGKTCSFKKSLSYLLETTQDEHSNFTIEKMYAVDCLLETFCSTRTRLNTHATRVVQLIQIHLSKDGYTTGGDVELALPDTTRILRTGRGPGEPTYPILYQVQAALGQSSIFHGDLRTERNFFFTPLQDQFELESALEDWSRVVVALEVLGVNQEEEEAFWLVLAAISNLGILAQQIQDGGQTAADPAVHKLVADLLGISVDDLRKVLQRPATPRTASPAHSIVPSTQSSRCSSPGRNINTGIPVIIPPPSEHLGLQDPLVLDNICRLAVNLYSDLLSRLVSLINRSIGPDPSNGDPHSSVILFDSPGFQNPSNVGERQNAGFVELCFNYLQERLQQVFSENHLDNLTEREKVFTKLLSSRHSGSSNSQVLNLIESTSSSMASQDEKMSTLGRRGSKKVRFTHAPPGLFTLLHKATNCPWSDDSTFVQRLTTHWGANKTNPLVESCGGTEFILHHMQGTNSVRYDARGWRQLSYWMGRTNLASEIFRKTTKPELKSVGQPQLLSGFLSSEVPGFSLDDIKARTSCLQVKVQVDAIIRLLMNTKISFVLCLQPHNLSGLCELFRKGPGKNLNQRLLREQMRGCQILDYLLTKQESGRLQEMLVTSRSAINKLTTEQAESLAVVQQGEKKQSGLLSSLLWHGLQLALVSAVYHMDMLESAVSQTVSSISTQGVTTGLAQVLLDADAGMIVLQNNVRRL